jgi:transposase
MYARVSAWLHRGLREAGIPIVCVETRHAQRFLSSRPVKTDKNDARGIAEMMRLGHYRSVHVKAPAAQSMRTTLTARMQLVASQLQIEGTIRGLLKVYGLKIGAVHRNRFFARAIELLEMAALPDLSAAIEPLLRVREGMRTERKTLDRTLAAVSRRSEVGRRLMTIPDVGPVTSGQASIPASSMAPDHSASRLMSGPGSLGTLPCHCTVPSRSTTQIAVLASETSSPMKTCMDASWSAG